ncbi:riboflavin synthase subunit alpha [Agrobacterium vitis]|uniref:riboflavin synthase subunit alpha n=1 Tax=Agrobacterium vitis TaxID=373 RepID=UPI0015D74977|nr:riboflavin synthase subunit alpha [Agrobacterium vitis]BCH60790.1 riboflavin synthase subunit alpha [Agrobacterium vitis]
MFTGIVSAVATVDEITGDDQFKSFTLKFPSGFCDDLLVGASVAVNGVCLTAVAEVDKDCWNFDVIYKSITATNLNNITVGQIVNVERSAREGAEIGGHVVSGHVDCAGFVDTIIENGKNKCIRIGFPKEYAIYLFSQGFVAINGASLTIADIGKSDCWIEVWLIPETRRSSNLDRLVIGDLVNIEIDRATQVVVETIRDAIQNFCENYLAQKITTMSTELLRERLLNEEDTRSLAASIVNSKIVAIGNGGSKP